MFALLKGFIVSIFLVTWASSVFAHEPQAGDSGVLHVLLGLKHFLGFVLIGGIAGLYIVACKSKAFIYGAVLPISLFASHSHVSLTNFSGAAFSLGFFCAGILITYVVASIIEVPVRGVTSRWLKP